ncbi:MAG TPA: MlaD family protein [Bacteroidales bacterium]|nr:MlaD family protein [Bacteroidales bacterium]
MEIRKEAKIGLIAVLVIAAAIWGFSFLKGKNIFTVSKQYYAVFSNIGGLQKSSVVSANGYTIGRVSDIQFVHGQINRIIVEVSIDRQFNIPSNSIVEIYSTDFMGSKAINMMLGHSNVFAHENDTLPGKFDGDISVLVTKKLLPLKEKGERLIESIDSVMLIIKNTFTPETQDNIRRGVASLEKIIVTQREKVAVIMDNLQDITNNLKQSNGQVTNTINNLSSFSDSLAQSNIKTAIRNANSVISETNLLMQKINQNQGSVGKLINEDSIYNSLESTLKDLDNLLIDLKANPKKYVHFSVFGRKAEKK